MSDMWECVGVWLVDVLQEVVGSTSGDVRLTSSRSRIKLQAGRKRNDREKKRESPK